MFFLTLNFQLLIFNSLVQAQYIASLLSTLDRDLTLAINGCHSSFFDNFFYIYTQTWTWIPAIVVLLVWMWRKWGVRSLYVVAGIALCILLADQISSSLLKPWVARLRPTHNPEIADLIHTVNGYRGGQYGFVSSHAANAATFVTFTALVFRNRFYTILLTLWAFLTASLGSVTNSIVAPLCLAISKQVSQSSFAGKYSSGEHATKCIPILAQVTIQELPMLKRASPIYTKRIPLILPKCSLIVNKSANICVG